MAKIAKLTWLHNGNYGSVLQAFALQKFLLLNGYDVIDLDYKADLKTKIINFLSNRNSLELFLGKYREAKGRRKYPHPELFNDRESKFNAFIKTNMIISQQFHSPNEIKSIVNDYDIYLCGSDQIWSPYLLNPVFYFSFVPKEKQRISYATSFGVTTTTLAKEKKIKSFLDNYQSISVREKQGRDFVKKLIGKDVPVCIDPTLLLKKSEWEQYVADQSFDRKYIFAFLLTPNSVYEQEVRSFAKNKKMEVIIVPTMQGPFNTGFEERVGTGPDEWLSYIKNAEYVFTDSFHAFIFSLIFEKEVFLFKRFNDDQKRSQNSRIYTITDLLNLKYRVIDQDNLKQIYKSEKIEYNTVKRIINNEAAASADWLKKALDKAIEQV